MMCSWVAMSLVGLAMAAFATPFSVPADDARWTITPRHLRTIEHQVTGGCFNGSVGQLMYNAVRAELLFNGTQLRVTGLAPPIDTQILMDGVQRPLPFKPRDVACVPIVGERQAPDGRTLHNLTIIPALNGMFLIAKATGIAPVASENTSPSTITAPFSVPHSLPPFSATQSSHTRTTAPAPVAPGPDLNTGLLTLGVVGLLALFLTACFGLYYYTRVRTRAKKQHPAASRRSRSFESMHETKYVLVYATDTVGGVKV